MKIENIKAALAKQAQLLGVSPVVMATTPKTASARNTPATVTAASKAHTTDNATLKVSATIASPIDNHNIKKIPSESQEPFPASQLTIKSAVDSVQPSLSIADSNQLSLTPDPVLIPDETKPACKTRKKEESLVVEPIEVIVAKHLKAGRDYDRLPNTSKPTLFKSGAEILCGVFGFRTTAQVTHRIEDYDKQFILYEVQVTIYGKDDKTVAEGIGSCNSRERKYLRGDFCTQLNTILKMAKKRAYVDAILTACHASKVFTQDVEDIAAGVAYDVSTKKGA